LRGIIATLALTIPMVVMMKLLGAFEALDAVLDGFKIMIPPLAIVVVAFMFKTVNDQLGLPHYVIESVQPLMSPLLYPVIVFLTMALVSFATGSSWGVFAIAIPIVMPLGAAMDVPTALTIGALLSASSFGSHACFYGDATVLSAQSSGINVMEHALTQLPYAVIAATAAAIAYVGYASIVL
jgi:Na+/H+ antiporter NhaC